MPRLNRYEQLGSTADGRGFPADPAPLATVGLGAVRTAVDVVASNQFTCAQPDNGDVRCGTTYEVRIAGRDGIPASSAASNLSTGNGFPTVDDCRTRLLASGIDATASGIDATASGVVDNEIVTELSPTGEICIFATTTTHLVIDAVGHLRARSPAPSAPVIGGLAAPSLTG